MSIAHRQITDAARDAWTRANALLHAARADGAERGDIALLADYADEQRDRWIRAWRAGGFRPDPRQVFAAIDCGAYDDAAAVGIDDYDPHADDRDDYGRSPDDEFEFDLSCFNESAG